MPVMTVRWPRPQEVSFRSSALPHPKAALVLEDGRRFEIPYAPVETELGGVAPSFESTPRPGRKLLLQQTGKGQRVLAYTLVLGYPDHQQPIENELHELRDISRSGSRLRFQYAASEGGWWIITDYSQRSLLRQHGTNAITRAEVTLTLTEAVSAAPKVGPLTGGARSAPAPAKGSDDAGATGSSTGSRRYTVRSGDTLFTIAQRFYGDGSKWPTVATANNITNPRTLRVGRELTIPEVS